MLRPKGNGSQMHAHDLMGWLLAAIVLGTILYQRCSRRFVAHLKEHHPSQWIGLGQPRAFVIGLSWKGVLGARFLFAREHRPLHDRALSLKADMTLATWLLMVGSLVAFIAVVELLPY